MSAKHGLTNHLSSLSEQELAELLRLRPDVCYNPEPHSLTELASRLNSPHSVHRALDELSLTGLALVEVICALGKEPTFARLHELLGGASVMEESRLADELNQLRSFALVWRHGVRLRMTEQLRGLVPYPLSLGRPASELLNALNMDQLKAIGARYGLRTPRHKADWVAKISAELTNPVSVRKRVAADTPELRALAERVAWHGPQTDGVFIPTRHQHVRDGHLGVELALNGWAIPVDQWSQTGEMPREVALALREQAHPTLPKKPKVPRGHALDPAVLLAAGQVAASNTVDGVGRLLTLLAHQPITMLQSGGVGVRELRRVAKQLHCREHQLRLWLETAWSAGLIWFADNELIPTDSADAWLVAEPAVALATLIGGWWTLPATPTHRVDDNGKSLPALGGRTVGEALSVGLTLRADVLGTYAEHPAGSPIEDLDLMTDLLAWRRPRVYRGAELLGPYAVATSTEAQAFGLVAEHALTPFGAALRTAARAAPGADNARLVADLAEALAGLLPPPTRTATFLPDLTAMVAGAPASELTILLNECADAESRDAASIWRFSPTSVRRALDAGRTADQLLTELTAITDKALPQPLIYLVRDLARKHGQLQVRPVACCVCADDPALATEVARNRTLAGLELAYLSETVLSSAKPTDETLAALRAAGYAPTKQDEAGRTVLERTKARRVAAPRRGQGGSPLSCQRIDPVVMARKLRGSAAPAEPEQEPLFEATNGIDTPDPEDLLATIGKAARQLSPSELAVLTNAIETSCPVQIDYLSRSSGLTSRVIEPINLEGNLVVAWCQLREDERRFALGRIAAVSPVLR
ncbi:MAG: helicase C-terminal domain-containing protein [Pseudonocardia sp.]|nr:helicase C-terminal domain-containing protein [Pseudonocardia sp.]